MSTFISRRESQEISREAKEQKRVNKLRHKDLMWAARRRYLDDGEWYELFVLDRTFGKWGPEQSEHEFAELEDLRNFFKQHSVGSKCPHLNALEKHLAIHAEKEKSKTSQASKKIVASHPSEKLIAK